MAGSDSTTQQTQSLLEEDLIRLDEIEIWTTDALKDYCRKRDYKVGGTRAELCARVYGLYNQRVPEQPGARERAISIRRDYKDIVNAGSFAPDPNTLAKWLDEKESIPNWPPVSYVEIVMFVNSQGSSLTKDALTSYKTGKAYSYFYNDWLQEAKYHPIRKEHSSCFVKATCMRSNAIRQEPHESWVKIEKQSGLIQSAFCSCMAGLSQVCNHVAALLFKLESAFRLGLSRPACTTTSCSWSGPRSKEPIFLRVADMTFNKPQFSKGKAPCQPKPVRRQSRHRETLSEDSDDKCYKDFISDLRSVMPTALMFLPGHSFTQETVDQSKESGNIIDMAKMCPNVKELLTRMTLTPDELEQLEADTRDQAESALWIEARKGRLTASNFYRVFTKVNSLRKDPSSDISKLIGGLLNPSPLGHLPQILHGKNTEPKALRMLERLFRKDHTDANIIKCGLFVHPEKQYMGASPDGILTCSCHGRILIEVKCPSKELSELTFLTGGSLKEKTAYYGQVQGQMAVTGIDSSYFLVYKSDSQFHLELVLVNQKFLSSLVQNLEYFYEYHFAPILIADSGPPLAKRRK